MSGRRYNFLLSILLIYGVWGIIFPINPFVFWDQCVYILHAKYFSGLNIGYNELSFRSPLLSLTTAPLALFNFDVIYYKIISIIWALLFPFSALYAFGKSIKRRQEALILLLLISLNGLLQWEAKFFLTDIPSLTLLLFSSGLSRRERPFLSGCFCGLGILMRLGNIALAPLILLEIIRKKRLKTLIHFSAGLLMTLLPYQIWIWSKYGNPIYNFHKAKVEGMRNAKFSLLKGRQIFEAFGGFAIFFSLLGLVLQKRYFLIGIFIYVILVIPYNAENLRFLLPLLPFVVLGEVYLLQKIQGKWKKVIFIILLYISFSSNHHWRSKMITMDREGKTDVQLVADRIKETYSGYPYIATGIMYPDFAFWTGKKVIPLARTYAKNGEFKYVDAMALRGGRALILTNNKTLPSKNYLESHKEFKYLETYKGLSFYGYKGGLKTGFTQYSAVQLYNHFDGLGSSGFIELNERKKVTQFVFTYVLSKSFVEKYQLKNCFKKNSFRMNDLNELTILNKEKDFLIAKIKPKTLEQCFNKKNIFFKVRFDLIREFD